MQYRGLRVSCTSPRNKVHAPSLPQAASHLLLKGLDRRLVAPSDHHTGTAGVCIEEQVSRTAVLCTSSTAHPAAEAQLTLKRTLWRTTARDHTSRRLATLHASAPPSRRANSEVMYTTDINAVASTSALAYPATKDAAAKEREDRLLAAKKKVSRSDPATSGEQRLTR